MKIIVKLFAFFRKDRFSIKEWETKEGTKVEDIMAELSITKEEMEIGIILVNGLYGTFQTVLKEGDVLALFPPAAGG
ncbi:MAG: MoaD/ThiS family protein [Bacillota bacterium]|jgi:molybdopterin synthase sulfur carrier subunit